MAMMPEINLKIVKKSILKELQVYYENKEIN